MQFFTQFSVSVLLSMSYLCNASDRDGDTMAGVDFVTLHIQSQGVECDSVA